MLLDDTTIKKKKRGRSGRYGLDKSSEVIVVLCLKKFDNIVAILTLSLPLTDVRLREDMVVL